ncbi:hypothetical protein [Nocardia carnea]|uniref:Uncharacterized protein n=1 Tax=Nocardia carnea TaxID=37328 RepID=A0ABW7TPU6_9NOCA|nr:hypothetical protein [Nocardia carnea]
MADTVRIRRLRPDLWLIGPPGAPTAADPDPGVDTAVLEVSGGYLTWSLTAGQRVAAAALHDLETAQEWLWALYGADVALAADAYTEPVDLPVRPGNPDLATAVRRLAYAHWAARWWPASTIDDIAALDPELLDSEIGELTEFCESVVDGADSPPAAGVDEVSAGPTGDRDIGRDTGAREWTTARADEYALAAGPNPSRGADLVLGRGTAGWDWRYCPAGVVDASERAVSWELFRAAGRTVARVHAVAAPGVPAELPGYLRPHALIRTRDGFLDVALELNGDAWTGETAEPTDAVLGVEIYVPGVGRSAPAGTGTPLGHSRASNRPPGSSPRASADDRPDAADSGAHADSRVARNVADPDAQPEPVGRPHGVDPVEPPQPSSAVERPTSGVDEEIDNTVAQGITGTSVDAERRRAVRELARNRLRLAAARSAEVNPAEPFGTGEFADSAGNSLADIAPLRSEVTAAMEDSDF